MELSHVMESYTLAAIEREIRETKIAERQDGEDDIVYFERLLKLVSKEKLPTLKSVLLKKVEQEQQEIANEMLALDVADGGSNRPLIIFASTAMSALFIFLALCILHEAPKPLNWNNIFWFWACVVVSIVLIATLIWAWLSGRDDKEDEYKRKKDEEARILEREVVEMRREECERYRMALVALNVY